MKNNSNNTNNVNNIKIIYYVVIDISEFTPFDKSVLEHGGFVGVKNTNLVGQNK